MSRKPIHYTNYETHHKQRSFLVFYFYAKEPADHYEKLLTENNIPFERGGSQDLIRRHLFGIHSQYETEVKRLNDETNSLFRKPFLSDKPMRNVVLIITLLVIALALAGWFLKK